MHTATFPTQIRIENTNHCNAECVMCPREQLTRKRGYMNFDFFKKLIDQAVAGGTEELHLQGFGEPFLDPELIDKIKYASSRGIKRKHIVSNASLIPEERAKELVFSGLDKIKVSFYGTNKKEYEDVHIHLNYETVKRNTERLFELKKKYGLKKPRIKVQYIGSIFKLLSALWNWRKYTIVGFNTWHNYGVGRAFRKVRSYQRKRSCAMVTRPIMQLLWTGQAVPCCYDFNGTMLLGDTRTTPMVDVWNGPAYQEFRRKHQENDFADLPMCASCDQLK